MSDRVAGRDGPSPPRFLVPRVSSPPHLLLQATPASGTWACPGPRPHGLSPSRLESERPAAWLLPKLAQPWACLLLSENLAPIPLYR